MVAKDSSTSKNKLMKISEFAKENELSARALRLYEAQGLITPIAKSEAGFRFYASEQQIRLKYIQKMKDLGCSLSEIQSLIHDWSQQDTASQGMQALELLYREKLQEVQTVIQKLQLIEQDLAESLNFIEGCHQCEADSTPQNACSQCARPQSSNLTLIRGITQSS